MESAIPDSQPMAGENEALGPYIMKRSEALERGDWKLIVQKAMDELAAGDNNAKWLTFYSCISANLPNKLHLFFMGRSQQGKSFIQTRIGAQLFPSIFLARDMSDKALYYEVREEKNPHFFEGKILHLDELGDRSESQLAFIKKLATNGTHSLEHVTVEDMKFSKMRIEGIPVIQTNSMKPLDDYGNQVSNRFFKASVNESVEQAEGVLAWQQREMVLGRNDGSQAIDDAKAAVAYIFERGGFDVRNPFAYCLGMGDLSGPKNRLPMFHTLLSCITYANWHQRIIFDGPRPILLASLSDNLEAIRLWRENELAQALALPNYLLDFLAIFNDRGDLGLTKAEMAEQYRLLKGTELSAETAYQYAHLLEEKDILTSRKREDERAYEWVKLDISRMSNKTALEFVPKKTDLLDEAVNGIKASSLMSRKETRETAEIVAALLDCPIPHPEIAETQTTLG